MFKLATNVIAEIQHILSIMVSWANSLGLSGLTAFSNLWHSLNK
jgi:hypothetical protein